MSRSWQARNTRMAISPRLATRTFLNNWLIGIDLLFLLATQRRLVFVLFLKYATLEESSIVKLLLRTFLMGYAVKLRKTWIRFVNNDARKKAWEIKRLCWKYSVSGRFFCTADTEKKKIRRHWPQSAGAPIQDFNKIDTGFYEKSGNTGNFERIKIAFL